jgi:hypothetical protein
MTKDCIEKVVITRLIGAETQHNSGTGNIELTLDFDVPNPNDLYRVVIEYDPRQILDISQLSELFEKYKQAISPISHPVWDETVEMLLAYR